MGSRRSHSVEPEYWRDSDARKIVSDFHLSNYVAFSMPKTKSLHRDGVLNPSGVRFGSAEIYNVVRLFPEIEDSVCVGQRRPQDRDESVMLFLKLKEGEKQAKALKERLKEAIGRGLSKRHIPKYVFYVDDIPYSFVGKKLEILVKNLVSGRRVESNVVANPASLAIYEKFFRVEEAAPDGNTQNAKL
jgi:acetoacetyl-CoA synthetase